MPLSLEQLASQVAALQKQVDALRPAGPALQTFAQMNDVKIGVNTPLAGGHAAVYDSAQHAWTNGSAGGGVSGYYAGGSPVTTSVPTASVTNLSWPTLTIGDALLDLSTIDTPLTGSAGLWTFDVTVALAAAAAPGATVLMLVRVTDGTTPFTAETHGTLLGSLTDDCVTSLSLTAAIAATSTIEVKALQTSGSTFDVRFDVAAVTGP